MNTLAKRLLLRARVADARQAWLEVEQLVDDEVDDKLDSEAHLVRYGMLGFADRLEQLLLGGERSDERDEFDEAVA